VENQPKARTEIFVEKITDFAEGDRRIVFHDGLQETFRVIHAPTQLLYSSDYPHWDFDLPSTIYDLPFLSEEAKRNILGGNAMRLFKLELGTEKLAGGPRARPTSAQMESQPG
jgi:predicted TIM-barrel fold metal-dependent hydrolase